MGEAANYDIWESQRVVFCGRDSELCSLGKTSGCDLWERERVVFFGIDSEL